MSVFDLPKYTGLVVFLVLTGIYWLWRWIHWDDSERSPNARNEKGEK